MPPSNPGGSKGGIVRAQCLWSALNREFTAESVSVRPQPLQRLADWLADDCRTNPCLSSLFVFHDLSFREQSSCVVVGFRGPPRTPTRWRGDNVETYTVAILSPTTAPGRLARTNARQIGCGPPGRGRCTGSPLGPTRKIRPTPPQPMRPHLHDPTPVDPRARATPHPPERVATSAPTTLSVIAPPKSLPAATFAQESPTDGRRQAFPS